jgi:transposase
VASTAPSKVAGEKRHILIDSGGILIAAVVTPGDTQHRAVFPAVLRQAKPIAPTIGHIWLDKGYTSEGVRAAATKTGITVDIVSGPKSGHGFIVQPRR